MSCYKLTLAGFEEVEEPVNQDAGDDYVKNITNAGYFLQVSSETHEGSSGSVVIYETNDETKPKYFIDVWGSSQQIASLVAEDFPHLVRTMKELSGLTALFGLDQQSDIQSEAILARKPAA